MAGVNGVNGSNSTTAVVDPNETGFSGLKSEDFLNLLITQLQNQDPTNPLESDQLLAQISDMRNLQASIELSSTLKSLNLSQQLTSATTFIGKDVSGSEGDQLISGVVQGVQVRDGSAYLYIDGKELALKNVETVAN